MNKNSYTLDLSAILDASGKEYAVDVPHPLPLPEGILEINASPMDPLLFGGTDAAMWSDTQLDTDTHWLARRPLPPVPMPPPQSQVDDEWAERMTKGKWRADNRSEVRALVLQAIAYGRETAK